MARERERKTGKKLIQQIQVRVRTKNGGRDGTMPGEDNQFLVFLEGETGYYFVPIKQSTDDTMELEMMAVLRTAFFAGKKVNLAYRKIRDNYYIMAAWIER